MTFILLENKCCVDDSKKKSSLKIVYKLRPTRINDCDMPDSDKVVMTIDERTLSDTDRRNSKYPEKYLS
jgi:hypothetical protein